MDFAAFLSEYGLTLLWFFGVILFFAFVKGLLILVQAFRRWFNY